MTATTPSPRAGGSPRRPRAAALVLLALAMVWIALRLPVALARVVQSAGGTWSELTDALRLDADQRIEKVLGLPAAIAQLLRRTLPEDGRLVVYSPYPGVAADLVRLQYERLKNLLYPRPREAAFARDAAELERHVEARLAGKLVVVDATQELVALPLPARFDLLTEQRLGAMRVRYWLLREGGR